MTKAEIQNQIFEQTGIKTSVKKLTGSMKKHTRFSPMLQNGSYPALPWEWRKEFIKQFKIDGENGNYHSDTSLDILNINIDLTSNPTKYKTERKPKTIDQMKVKTWGSKNSQLRLDKTAARYAKKAMKPNFNGVRYW